MTPDGRPIPFGPSASALAQHMLSTGFISRRRLEHLESESRGRNIRLADSLRTDLAMPPSTIATAQAGATGSVVVDPLVEKPDPRLVTKLGTRACLRHSILPWKIAGGTTVILTARPDLFIRQKDMLKVLFGPVVMAVTTEEKLQEALKRQFDRQMIAAAETKVADQDSCRSWQADKAMRVGLSVILIIVTIWVVTPAIAVGLLCGWAVFTLLLSTALKAAAALATVTNKSAETRARAEDKRTVPAHLPTVSILVPLFEEREIAAHLLTRLSRLKYPRALLDICLVLEEDDQTTLATLAQTKLPPWMRAIKVPRGALKTKPRALNYALDFTRGSIIGVYDAEDAPAEDQIERIVARFASRGPDVACLQGVLSYYNSETNWLARCFAIEYATWFRVVLPGMAKMGLVVPLGGTTLFFRRDILEQLGGWDAHNVTEDADLGIRLARRGYRTELIDTVTQEEANCRVWPWIKQRSRWLKGYAVTYAVHMRNPVQLWKDLGAWRFFGVQLLLAGTLSQFLLAPLLWSFWLVVFGLPHPLSNIVSHDWMVVLGGVFIASELISISVATYAVIKADKTNLIKWVPTLTAYFPLAAIAAYKGIFELATKPFYWDKTVHGVFTATKAPASPHKK